MLARQLTSGTTTGFTLCLLFAALSGACTTPEPRTQVMLIINADDEVKALASKLKVEIASRSEYDLPDGDPVEHEFATDQAAPSPTWPFSIPLLPRAGDARRQYRITAKLSDGTNLIAVLRAHSGFIAQRSLELRLYFTASCLHEKSIACQDPQTCFDGACVSARIEVDSLRGLSGDISNDFAPAADGGTSSSRNPVMTDSSGTGGAGGKKVGAGGMSGPGKERDGGTAGEDAAQMSGGDCGDGRVNDGEKCDTMIPPGAAGACPTECVTLVPCEPMRIEGSGCQTFCMPYPITVATPDDGCCPDGADASSDNDCAAACGNGMIEAGETCDPPESCPTPTTCEGASACLRATVLGDAASCNVTCEMHKVEMCMSGDGCCPDTCTNATDSECSASCGNGTVDAGETCEPGSATPCPTTCDDGDPCSTDFTTGNEANCNVACTHVPITAPRNGDTCCPPGSNANNDNDCKPTCGNGVREGTERCDGRCLTNVSQCEDFNFCTTQTLTGTAANCDVQCNYTFITALAAGDSCCPFGANNNTDKDCLQLCGNGAREGDEKCDGNCPKNPDSCPNDNNACTVNIVNGSECQRVCATAPAQAGRADGCCLDMAGMSQFMDPDCPARCGNGQKETGETCDPCPTSCTDSDSDPCTRVQLTGDACTAQCTTTRIAVPANGDGCCPMGANSANDDDCPVEPKPSVCPNGVPEEGEVCDGNCPSCVDDRDPCTTDKNIDDPDECHPRCVHQPIGASLLARDQCCPSNANANTDIDCMPVCPNGVKEDGENCDGDCPSCVDTNPCTSDTRNDVPDKCHPTCENNPIGPSRGAADGCCPLGANSGTDTDCKNPPPPPDPVCGNRQVESGERCDPPSTTCSNDCTMILQPPEPEPDPTPNPDEPAQ